MKGHLWSSVGGAVGLMACGVLISSGAEAEDDAKEHRNLLLISMDTCRYDHMGLAGYSRDTTPNIDRLAELGTNFTRAFAQSNETLFSHASILSGKYTGDIRPFDKDFYLPESLDLLPEVLKNYGYATAGFVAGGHLKSVFGFADGFDIYEDEYDFGSLFYTAPMAMEWLELNRDKPFFLFLHGYDCHSNYAKPHLFHHMYDSEYTGIAEEIIRDGFGIERVYKQKYFFEAQRTFVEDRYGRRVLGEDFFQEILPSLYESEGPSIDVTPRDMEHIIAHYDSSMAYGDMWVGLVMSTLLRLQLDQNTMVVVFSDHGESLGDYDYMHHRPVLRDKIIHVPLVVYAPFDTDTHGKTVDEVVETIDILPTVLQYLGARPPDGISGRSLVSRIRESNDEDRMQLAFSESRSQASVRSRYGQLVFEKSWLKEGENRTLDQLYGFPIDGRVFSYFAFEPSGEESANEMDAHAVRLQKKLLDWLRNRKPVQVMGEFEGMEALDDLKVVLQEKGYW